MLSGGIQRRPLPRHQSGEIFQFLEWGSNSQPIAFKVTLTAHAPGLASIKVFMHKQLSFYDKLR